MSSPEGGKEQTAAQAFLELWEIFSLLLTVDCQRKRNFKPMPIIQAISNGDIHMMTLESPPAESDNHTYEGVSGGTNPSTQHITPHVPQVDTWWGLSEVGIVPVRECKDVTNMSTKGCVEPLHHQSPTTVLTMG